MNSEPSVTDLWKCNGDPGQRTCCWRLWWPVTISIIIIISKRKSPEASLPWWSECGSRYRLLFIQEINKKSFNVRFVVLHDHTSYIFRWHVFIWKSRPKNANRKGYHTHSPGRSVTWKMCVVPVHGTFGLVLARCASSRGKKQNEINNNFGKEKISSN